MERVMRFLADAFETEGYLDFQNDLAEAMYAALAQGYLENDKELGLVKRLVDATDGMGYDRLRLRSRKIHDRASRVAFNHQGKKVTTELGDAVFITVITAGRKRLLQRVCFVQNKKATAGTWAIDPQQLCLLTNFPRLLHGLGIAKGVDGAIFKNLGGTLGAFGLLAEPGEMMLIAAPVLAEIERGRGRVRSDEVSLPSADRQVHRAPHTLPNLPNLPWLYWDPRVPSDDLWMMLHEFYRSARKLGPGLPWPWAMPYALGGASFMRSIHDFARNWTRCNVGEYCYALGRSLDDRLDRLAAQILASIGAGELFDIPGETPPLNEDAGIAIFLTHVNVGEG